MGLKRLVQAFAAARAASSVDWYGSAAAEENAQKVITRDFTVIGGGSSRTYAAVNLQAMGYDVLLVEKEAVLGVHLSQSPRLQTLLLMQSNLTSIRISNIVRSS
jgi:heterodisulfide reductase subunit A-like polyferredoxin